MRKPSSKINYLPKAKAWHDQDQACSMRGDGAGLSSASTSRQPRGPKYLVGQLLVQLLSNGVIELPLKLPRGGPYGVHHLHQDEHPGLRRGLWERDGQSRIGAWSGGDPKAPSILSQSLSPTPPITRLAKRLRGRAWGAPRGACSATAKGEN